MILVIIAILSIIVALIRKGSFSNIREGGLKAWILLLLSVLVFAAVYIGDYMAVSFIQDFAFIFLMAAYALLILGLLLNLNIVTFIMLLGTLLNFVVVFINGGKMPISAEMASVAGMSAEAINASAIQALATQSTHLPILGGIVPIPLPSVLAQVISPGTIIIALGLFFEIQNLMLGVVYDYEDDEDEDEDIDGDGDEEDDAAEHEHADKKSKRSRRSRNRDEDSADDEDGEEFELSKDYTVGDIDIHETDRLPKLDAADSENSEDEDDEDEVDDFDMLAEEADDIEDDAESEFQNTAAFFDTIGVHDINDDKEAESEEDVFDTLNSLNTVETEEPEPSVPDLETDPFDNLMYGEPEQEEPSENMDYHSGIDVDAEESEEAEEIYEAEEIPVRMVEADPYENYTAEDLTLRKDALIEAKSVLENDFVHKNEEPVHDAPIVREKQTPVEVDTDSPFIIVGGRIVENPYYKFRRGTKEDDASPTEQIGNGVYVMKSRNPSIAGRPSFAPPNKPAAETSVNKEKPSVKVAEIKPQDAGEAQNGYERVEMQIGDVQIKFWKKDSNE